MLLSLLSLLLLQWSLTSGATDPIYLVAVTSQAMSGSTETLCAHIQQPKESVSIAITLKSDNQELTILRQGSIRTDFYKCVTFRVPLVSVESVASINVTIQGVSTFLNKTTQMLIIPSQKLLFIQSDRPIYKPGQTVKFRIVSLDSKFLPHNQVFKIVELQDPSSNRIGQWLNQSTNSGILDLFHSMSPEAAEGYYTITARDEKDGQIFHSFEIKQYVLPKYEVNIDFPSVITPLDREVTLKVCAKYTYGKPVQGSMTVEVCGNGYGPYRYYENFPDNSGFCKTFSTMTGTSGCGSWVINATEFGVSGSRSLNVQTNVEESGTGITMSESTSAWFSYDYVYANFEDTPDTYKPGTIFNGKIVVRDTQSKPVKDEPLILYAYYGAVSVNMTLTTDINGMASFSFNTSAWSELPVQIQVNHRGGRHWTDYRSIVYYPLSYLYVRPFHSKSKSFLTLANAPQKLSCNGDATVVASYIIQGGTLNSGQKTLDFFYIVLSRGSMAQNGRLSAIVRSERENRGQLTFSLKNMASLAPYAQVVVYTILPSGEAVADSMNFPIEECLPNQVSLKFSSPTALPGQATSFNLKANPGSLCSVRAIDQSVLLLRPEAELNAEFVFGMLRVQILSGYPYNIEETEPNPCPVPFRGKRSRFYYPYYGLKNDVYNIFRGIGIKIATNSDVKAPIVCDYGTNIFNKELDEGRVALPEMPFLPSWGNPSSRIRRFFPETWIWDLIPVGRSGSVDVPKTVPDTITTWAAGAFCTSPVGFGVAPKTNLTAFKPFFVSLTLPYSVIRGETFTLRATVFNYLTKCIRVKVTLADSSQFTVEPCEGCEYTQCICAEESKTFDWTVSPSALGTLNFTVRAEALKTPELCDNQEVTWPGQARIDTVMQTVLVEAEGTKQSITQNEFICVTDRPQVKSVTLTLPQVYVTGSDKNLVTVLGDLMGRALKNIGYLLSMPQGCGEQKMSRIAPNIYILQYLESSGQLTPEIKAQAINFLETGYQDELTYKRDDGSYSFFGMRDTSGNIWLTAFVMKTFGGARRYIFIDQTHIDQAKDWLGRQQQSNGCFSSGRSFSYIMGGINNEVTLSAYITAAMLELGVPRTDTVVVNSLNCLRQTSRNITNTYVNALLFYTFTLAGEANMRQSLLSTLDRQARVEGAGRYWAQDNNAQAIETTAYVLLGLHSGPTLPRFGLNYSASIVHWLGKQQNPYGGFSSTQDTVVALQALAKYSAATYNPEGTITLTVTSPSGQRNQFTVNRNNRLLYQEKQLQETTGTFTLRAEGRGCVFVQFALHYNIPPLNARAFNIKTNTGVCNKNNRAFTLTVTVRYDGTRVETNMVIINVRLLSGHRLDETALQALRQDPTVKRVDLDGDRVYIYLESLRKNQEKMVSMQLLQDVPVQNLKPAVVIVYDYYMTSEMSVVDYNSPCA